MNWFYFFVKNTVKLLFKVILGVKEMGVENIPAKGPFIVAANHVSFFDPPLVGSFFPLELAFAAKKELFKIPVFSTIISNLNAFPIDRHNFQLSSFKTMINVVRKENKCLLIFPEGTRKNDVELDSGKRGVGAIVQKTKVPVIPVYILNSKNKLAAMFRLKPLLIYFGKPVDMIDIDSKDREYTVKVVDRTLAAIKDLKGKLDAQ